MDEVINQIIISECDALNELLVLLQKQHKSYLNKDLFALEDLVGKIEKSNISIARLEVQKKQALGSKTMKEFIAETNDHELKINLREMKKVVQIVKLQNETNQVLFKQGLIFTNKMINIFKPNNSSKTYNGYGKINK